MTGAQNEWDRKRRMAAPLKQQEGVDGVHVEPAELQVRVWCAYVPGKVWHDVMQTTKLGNGSAAAKYHSYHTFGLT